MRLAVILAGLAFAFPALAYVPAVPTNDTDKAIAGGLNVTDISKLYLQWSNNGFYSRNVSFQLSGNGSTGVSKGVLVHFSEEYASNLTQPTLTPWIALVSCDRNATNVTMDDDIFTLARDKGAVAAVLYSLSSTACIINPEYADPSRFDQVFDIFSTQFNISATLIEFQFGQLSGNNTMWKYDSKALNDSQSDIEDAIKRGSVTSTSYLLGMLRAYNASDGLGDPIFPGTSPLSGTSPPKTSQKGTALAMIILYAITGCVSALFLVVIVSGAIRAIRHPERYGPRRQFGHDGEPPQSRALGLTRAILDTFPVVKFGAPTTNHQTFTPMPRQKDGEDARSGSSMEMSGLRRNVSRSRSNSPAVPDSFLDPGSSGARGPGSPIYANHDSPTRHGDSSADISSHSRDIQERSSRNTSVISLNPGDVAPSAIGRETCPICIVAFEEGDDIRVLPCDGKHCFHQQCVDPWLLQLSSSCPICRHDFLALENMLAGHDEDEEEYEQENEPEPEPQTLRPPRPQLATRSSKFSRYLRFARRRHSQRRAQEVTEPMPTAIANEA